MGRDVKDELNPLGGGLEENAGTATGDPERTPPAENTMQITLSPEMEKMLIDIVMDDYETAKKSRNERNWGTTSKGVKLDFEKWRKELLDLYNSERIPKTVPWKFCANRSLRIAKAILDMLHARLFPSVCNEYLLNFKALNVASFPKLDRIEKLMMWWLFVHSRVRQQFDDWVKVALGFGDVLAETSWEAYPRDMGHTEQKPVTGPDGQPMFEADGSPSVVTSRLIELEERTVTHIYTRDKFFLQPGSKNIEREPVVLEEEFFYRDLQEGEIKGQFVNIEAELREKLPFSKDGFQNLPPEEIERLKDVRLRNQAVKILKWYGSFDADGDGFAEDIRVYISQDYKLYLGGIAMTNITKSGRRPIDFTKIESRLDSPTENIGYGVLETVKELAEEIDAIFNQLSDENTLNVMKPGFYDPGGDLEAASLSISPNRWQPVSDPQRNIYIPPVQSNTDKLIMAIRLVTEFIERLTAASSYVMGKESEIVGGSGTATRTNAIMNSANERFALPAERLRQGAANIIRHHLDELQLNIPMGLEERILGDDGSPIFKPNELSMEGIAGEYDAFLLPDPSMGSKDVEQQVAQMMYTLLMQNPIVATDPTKIYRLTAELIKAFGKDYKWYLGPEPDMDMVDSPEDENTLILQGMFKDVQAQFPENHMLHIQKHMELLQSPSLAAIPPALLEQVTGFTTQHIQQHMQMQQLIMKAMAGPGGKKGGEPNGEDGGEDPGRVGGNQGDGSQPGLENLSGPLGQALNTKRSGESGGHPPQRNE